MPNLDSARRGDDDEHLAILSVAVSSTWCGGVLLRRHTTTPNEATAVIYIAITLTACVACAFYYRIIRRHNDNTNPSIALLAAVLLTLATPFLIVVAIVSVTVLLARLFITEF